MTKRYTDAHFEVVSGPMRQGDPHPIRARWVYAGRYDRWGNPLWYRPPRFSRLQLFGMICAAMLAFRIAVYVGLDLLHRY